MDDGADLIGVYVVPFDGKMGARNGFWVLSRSSSRAEIRHVVVLWEHSNVIRHYPVGLVRSFLENSDPRSAGK